MAEVTIDIRRYHQDFIAFLPNDMKQIPQGVSVFLTHAVYDWVTKHPEFRVRASLGIVENGETIMIHLWIDEVSS